MAEESMRDKDMVLAPNESMYVQDETKGHIDLFLGPTKQSLSKSDSPVIFDEKSKRFIRVDDYRRATQVEKVAPAGWYIVLKNPARGEKPHPTGQGKVSAADLDIGRKVNIPGPCNFSLWPGQMAKVIKGHHLRSNQYLLVRVYDAEAARKNWVNARVERAGTASTGEGSEQVRTEAAKDQDFAVLAASDLTMGQIIVIKGTDVSFFIPPTGMEVVPDESNKLVREAVTLARLEFCLLLDEDGNKRYPQGPAVVFPEPTEVFVERPVDPENPDGPKTRKFRAIELNENTGVYIKVIADYKDEATGKEYKTGEELFITGKDTMIYFPREEHAMVKYGSSERHFGIAIPGGEGRYVLDRNKGSVDLVKGATVFLPDPRTQVIVRRVLDFKTCNLLYPNNLAAFQHNATLMGVDLETYMQSHPSSVANIGLEALAAMGPMGATGPQGPMGARGLHGAAAAAYGGAAYTVLTSNAAAFGTPVGDSLEARGLANAPARGMVGDQFQRKNAFTAPRMITIDSKFDGAVQVDVWTGYAMLLVRKSGERRIVKGPQSVMLAYDEFPQALTLSTGKPKTTDNMIRTAFLKTDSNIVTDVVEVETDDFCKLRLKLSYRVNFEGDENKWFNVENYVKFLCDHMRSKIRNAVQKQKIEQFYGNYTDSVRDVVLGKNVGPDGKPQERPGTSFKENGMRIYDVEVLNVEMVNKDIEKLLVDHQRKAIETTLLLKSKRQTLENTKELELISQQTEETQAETRIQKMQLEAVEATKRLERDLAVIEANSKAEAEKNAKDLDAAKAKALVSQVSVEHQANVKRTELALSKEAQAITLANLEAEVRACVEKGKAFTPDLIAALQAFGDKELIERAAKSMAPLAILGGESVGEVLAKLLAGTPLAKQLTSLGQNGTAPSARA